jgi:Threonine dehydrogenase and related Zn-dependent dehydrogenases
MRVARLHAVADLRLADEPGAGTRAGESLVRVTAVGICGSDLHWWDEGAIGDARLTHPLVLGHEGAGVIADGPRRGERVAIDPAIPDETCRACRDGYRNLCYRIRFSGHGETDGMLREVMAWPSGCCIPSRRRVRRGRGHAGAARGSDPLRRPGSPAVRRGGRGDRLRADRAAPHSGAEGGGRQFGAGGRAAGAPAGGRRADGSGQVAGSDAALDDAGVDVAFEAAGNDEAVGLAMASVRPGGRVVLAGIPGDDSIRFGASLARRKGLTIAMVRRMNEVYPRAIGLAARGVVDLGSVVTSRFGLGEVREAFADGAKRTGLKVVVEPQR